MSEHGFVECGTKKSKTEEIRRLQEYKIIGGYVTSI
jgi:hypothetical protein